MLRSFQRIYPCGCKELFTSSFIYIERQQERCFHLRSDVWYAQRIDDTVFSILNSAGNTRSVYLYLQLLRHALLSNLNFRIICTSIPLLATRLPLKARRVH